MGVQAYRWVSKLIRQDEIVKTGCRSAAGREILWRTRFRKELAPAGSCR